MGTKIKMEFTRVLSAKETAKELRKLANEISKKIHSNVAGMGAIDIDEGNGNYKSYCIEPIAAENGGEL